MSYNLTSDAEKQTEEAKNLARARQSLIEELDAINVYEERFPVAIVDKIKLARRLIGVKKKNYWRRRLLLFSSFSLQTHN
jgi:hypothetical protein